MNRNRILNMLFYLIGFSHIRFSLLVRISFLAWRPHVSLLNFLHPTHQIWKERNTNNSLVSPLSVIVISKIAWWKLFESTKQKVFLQQYISTRITHLHFAFTWSKTMKNTHEVTVSWPGSWTRNMEGDINMAKK
jgi:hypothetical protein